MRKLHHKEVALWGDHQWYSLILICGACNDFYILYIECNHLSDYCGIIIYADQDNASFI